MYDSVARREKEALLSEKIVALVAHDGRKMDIVQWANAHKDSLAHFSLTGTHGTAEQINKVTGLNVQDMGHGPDGGDIEIAHQIIKKRIDILVFFIDTRTAHGHEHDIQTLIRTCVTQNVPMALNKATATAIIKAESQE